MTIYYQHVGERMALRDFPVSLGTRQVGLKRFRYEDVQHHLGEISPRELNELETRLRYHCDGVQIWGFPSGAETRLSRMGSGDFVMLLEHVDFQYCGHVVHRLTRFSFDLSKHIWGEERFPIIIFLQGTLISYEWQDFLSDLNFNSNYHLRGTTQSVCADRLATSKFKTEDAFIAHVLATQNKAFDPERM